MDYLKFFNKIFLILCLSVLFSSCKKWLKSGEVTSGANQNQTLVFSKSCNSNSFQIFKEASVTLETQPVGSVSGLGQLKQGDKVSIKGTIANGSPCYQGSVSFTCSARVAIDQNRSFFCETGTVQGGGYIPGSSPGTTPPAPAPGVNVQGGVYTTPGVPGLYGRPFLKGDFHTFGNGQQAYGRIVVGSSSQLAPQAVCVVSFFCL